jgi:hypothetical protein
MLPLECGDRLGLPRRNLELRDQHEAAVLSDGENSFSYLLHCIPRGMCARR